MDILNFINWVRSRRVIKTTPAGSLIPVGVKDSTRDDKYITCAIATDNLASAIGALTEVITDGVTITGDGTLANPLVAAAVPSFTYEIGQYVASEGGVIAHRWLSSSSLGKPTAGSVENYLVVDTGDLGIGQIGWGLYLTDVPGAASRWDGSTNTAQIVATPGSAGFAASLCNALTSNGKSDWYLPAIDELVQIYVNEWAINQGLEFIGGNLFLRDSYWSSTELSSKDVEAFAFNTGTLRADAKTNTFYVRPVRRFSI